MVSEQRQQKAAQASITICFPSRESKLTSAQAVKVTIPNPAAPPPPRKIKQFTVCKPRKTTQTLFFRCWFRISS